MTPTAEAAWEAYNDVLERVGVCEDHGDALAEFLEVVTDHVAPSDAAEPRNNLPMALECQRIRSQLLAIAAELRGLH